MSRKRTRESRFWYVNDDGEVVAARYQDWKVVFLENRGQAFGVWREPLVQLRVPLLFNLRRDPFEKAQHNANAYEDWFLDRPYVIVPIQALAAQFLLSMKEFPPSQEPGSFNFSKIEEMLRRGIGGSNLAQPWTERVYGIPPEQVVGSSIKTTYEVRNGKPALVRQPQIDFFDDKNAKPIAINHRIGRRPLSAFGNSDGDFQMLEWTTAGDGPRLGVLIHHNDSEREWAYDRKSHIGKLACGLDEADARGWIVVSMKDDWSLIFR
jgi:hypothetical protein